MLTKKSLVAWITMTAGILVFSPGLVEADTRTSDSEIISSFTRFSGGVQDGTSQQSQGEPYSWLARQTTLGLAVTNQQTSFQYTFRKNQAYTLYAAKIQMASTQYIDMVQQASAEYISRIQQGGSMTNALGVFQSALTNAIQTWKTVLSFAAKALQSALGSNSLNEIQSAYLSQAVYKFRNDGPIVQDPTSPRNMLRHYSERADFYGELSETNHPQAVLFRQRADENIAYLVRAQREGGTGVFGIPDGPNTDAQFDARIKAIHAQYDLDIQNTGRSDIVFNNGWIVSLSSKGIPEFYYDHGVALTSVARAYQRTGDATLLPVIRAAANWALDKPMTSNVNFLTTLIRGLSSAYGVTGDQRYLDKAVTLFKEGVFPNQIKLGDNAGQWNDPHNALPVYHGLIVTGLLGLREYLPKKDPKYQQASTLLDQSLELAIGWMKNYDLSSATTFDSQGNGGRFTHALAWWELSRSRALTPDEEAAWRRVMNPNP